MVGETGQNYDVNYMYIAYSSPPSNLHNLTVC